MATQMTTPTKTIPIRKHDAATLKQLQALDLDEKIKLTRDRIQEWYDYWNGNVVISFSGGKDSTVLLHIARQLYPDIKAVFSDTGLEFPEIKEFVRSIPNVEIIRPRMTFHDVLTQYGYPLISKEVANSIKYARRNPDSHGEKTAITKVTELLGTKMYGDEPCRFNKTRWLPLVYTPFRIDAYCCEVMKKSPTHIYAHANKIKFVTGTLACESRMRLQAWMKSGCNAYDARNPLSQPIAFWTDQDVLEYIHRENLPICPVYGDIIQEFTWFKTTGMSRTGCVFCGFGLANRLEWRFTEMQNSHPQLYDYCMRGGQWIPNPNYDPTLTDKPNDLGWIPWNPKQLWVPSANGLGYDYVFECVNAIYPDLIKYKDKGEHGLSPLKPCPFCGSTVEMIQESHGDDGDVWVVKCSECGASRQWPVKSSSGGGKFGLTKGQAITEWNKRS